MKRATNVPPGATHGVWDARVMWVLLVGTGVVEELEAEVAACSGGAGPAMATAATAARAARAVTAARRARGRIRGAARRTGPTGRRARGRSRGARRGRGRRRSPSGC